MGGTYVEIDQRMVARLLRAKGQHDRAAEAVCSLPSMVNTDQDAGLLHDLGLEVAEVEAAGDDAASSRRRRTP